MNYSAPWRYMPNLSASENHKGYKVVDSNGYWVADVSPRDEDGIKGKILSDLIAAAPAMLEALEDLIAGEDAEATLEGYMAASERARAAIRAAKGGA